MATGVLPAVVYPRGRFRTTDLDTTAQSVKTTPISVASFRIVGGAAQEIVIFRAADDSPVYFQVVVGAGAVVESTLPWYAEEGLELLTASLAGDVEVVIHYLEF